MLPILINVLLAFHIVVSILIVFVVLMQRPKNEGLGAAFGGGMTENLFGAQTTNVLANFTRWLGGLFFFLTLTLSILYAKETNRKSDIEKQLLSAPAVAKKAPALDPSVLAGATATPPVQVPGATVEQAEAADNPAVPAEAPIPAPGSDAAPAPGPTSPAPEAASGTAPDASSNSVAPAETKDAPPPAPPTPDASAETAPPASSQPPVPSPDPSAATKPAPTPAAPNP